ncbi:MAG: RNA methyltransferase, partial [Bacteroidales bacterium]
MPNTRPTHLTQEEKEKILTQLLTFVSANKQERFSRHIAHRTRHITVVLEDIFQPHNASAVLRSCDCFGIQEVHIIENENTFEVNPDVALGAAKWLNVEKHNRHPHNTVPCLSALKKRGYLLIATSPHTNEFTPESIPLDQPIALLFGTELTGLSEEASAMADMYVRIPMVGFTESLNISVSAAILLYTLTTRLHRSGIHWALSPEEKTTVLIQWASAVIRKPNLIIRKLIDQ